MKEFCLNNFGESPSTLSETFFLGSESLLSIIEKLFKVFLLLSFSMELLCYEPFLLLSFSMGLLCQELFLLLSFLLLSFIIELLRNEAFIWLSLIEELL